MDSTKALARSRYVKTESVAKAAMPSDVSTIKQYIMGESLRRHRLVVTACTHVMRWIANLQDDSRLVAPLRRR